MFGYQFSANVGIRTVMIALPSKQNIVVWLLTRVALLWRCAFIVIECLDVISLPFPWRGGDLPVDTLYKITIIVFI